MAQRKARLLREYEQRKQDEASARVQSEMEQTFKVTVLKGDKGDKGDIGPPGVNGEHGKDGARGDRGERGESGPSGLPGRDGRDGEPGTVGPPGRDGKDGVPGRHGRDGRDRPRPVRFEEINDVGGRVVQYKVDLSDGTTEYVDVIDDFTGWPIGLQVREEV